MHSTIDDRVWLAWLVKVRILILTVLLGIELAIVQFTPVLFPMERTKSFRNARPYRSTGPRPLPKSSGASGFPTLATRNVPWVLSSVR